MSVCFCGGEKNEQEIPVRKVISALDELLNKNDLTAAREHLNFWCAQAAEAGDLGGELAVVNELIGFYRKQGERENAFGGIRRAEELIEALDIGREVSAGTVLLNIGTAYCAFSLPEKALEYYERARAIYDEKLSADDALYGGLCNNAATALCDLGRYDEAKQNYLRALDIMKKIPSGRADVAITYVNLAHLEDKREPGCAAAEENLAAAREILDAPDIPRDGYYAFVCTKCAPSFGYFGFFSYRRQLENRAKEIYEGA